MIRLDPNWKAQMEEMNRSEMGRPFTYPDLLMSCIAYLRHMIGKGLRITEGVVDKMLVEEIWAVKPEYIMIEIATKIAVYNNTRYIMSKAVW